MKSILKKVAEVLLVGAFVLGIVGCPTPHNRHDHTFAAAYTSSETHHWCAATCGHADQVKNKAEHVFGGWTITKQPTEDAEGLQEKECSVCHYKVSEAVAKLEHVHAKGTFHAAVAGTCNTKGTVAHYDCAKSTCSVKLDAAGNPLSTTDGALDPANHAGSATTWTKTATIHKETYDCCDAVKTAEAAHSWDEGVVTKEPTEDAEGLQEKECSVCHYKVSEAVAKLEHVHKKGTFHEAVAGTCNTKGTVAHYDCAKSTCSVKLDAAGNPLSTTDGALDPANHAGSATTWTKTAETHKETYDCCDAVKTAEAVHSWDEGVVTKQSTTIEEGIKTFTCTVEGCGQNKTEAIEKLPMLSSELGDYLSGLADNTVDNLYKISLKDLTTDVSTALIANPKKYVELTLSDSVTLIGDYAFEKCTSLTSVTIPDSVTSIGGFAFQGCTNLTSITIPESVTSIGTYAFRDCTSLTSVTIPESVTSIGESAFWGCTSLTSVTIPDSVTKIGIGAFRGCSRLESINYKGTEEQWTAISKGSDWNYKVPTTCVINYNYQG